MALQTYEAVLSRQENVARVRAAQPEIERVGGQIHIAPPNARGTVLVGLALPPGYTPDRFPLLAGIPFYPT